MTTPGLGHNNGPTMEKGAAWRRHCWRQARAELLPKLPLPVLKRRLKRARELGLPYPLYATARAATGRDIIALLFSQNALRLPSGRVELPEARAARLRSLIDCDRAVAVQGPPGLEALEALLQQNQIPITRLAAAPRFVETEPQIRAKLDRLRGSIPGDAVLLIGETAFERSWCATGRLAGYVPSDRYFEVGP